MHPILASRRLLLLYLLAWVPVLALLCAIAAAGLPGSPLERAGNAAAVLAPACLVAAFAALSPWYIVRVQPLRLANLTGLATTYTGASLAAGSLLAGCAWLAALLLDKAPPPWPLLLGMGVMLYLVSVGAHYTALAAAESRAALDRAAEARTLAREAQLHALRIQLNPHFLFNSLHSISALATQDGPRAREMCIRLADFLRSSLALGDRESIPLSDELSLARAYLAVEHVRFGHRLRVETEIESACEDCAIPALLLQPLIENAVKHGVAGLLEGTSIRLAAHHRDGHVSITFDNAYDPETSSANSLGLGLAHVRRRLEVRYGPLATLTAAPRDGLFHVELSFPCEKPSAT